MRCIPPDQRGLSLPLIKLCVLCELPIAGDETVFRDCSPIHRSARRVLMASRPVPFIFAVSSSLPAQESVTLAFQLKYFACSLLAVLLSHSRYSRHTEQLSLGGFHLTLPSLLSPQPPRHSIHRLAPPSNTRPTTQCPHLQLPPPLFSPDTTRNPITQPLLHNRAWYPIFQICSDWREPSLNRLIGTVNGGELRRCGMRVVRR